MSRPFLALCLALVLGACAPDPGPSEPLGVSAETVNALEERLGEVETDLLGALDDETAARERLQERLDEVAARLDRSLVRLKDALAGIKTGSVEAREVAASALANAQAAASQLNVLEERYNYHLRRYHGGGG